MSFHGSITAESWGIITILQGKGMENHPCPASITTAMCLPPALAEIMH